MPALTHPVFRPLLCLFVIIVWALNFVAIKLSVEELAPQTALAARFIFTTLFYLPFLRWPKKEKLGDIFKVSLLMCTIHQGFLFACFSFFNPSTLAILMQSQVVFSVLLGMVFFKEKIGWRMMTGILLGFVGLVVIFGAPQVGHSPEGFIMAMLSAGFLAYSYIKMKDLQDIHAPTFLCLINGMAIPFVCASALIFESDHVDMFKNANWLIVLPVFLFQAILVSGGHALWQKLLAVNPVGTIVPFALLIPVFGVAASVLAFGDTITPELLIGGGITLAGVSIITARRLKKHQPIDIEGPE